MNLRGLVFVLAAVLLLSACVTGVPTTPAATPTETVSPATPGPVGTQPAYPGPNGSPYPGVTLLPPTPQAYPAATVAVTAATGSLYPDAADNSEVSWEQATALIYNQEVSKVTQSHDLKVYLALKDGRTLFATEPNIDDIMLLIKQCGEPCSKITVATE